MSQGPICKDIRTFAVAVGSTRDVSTRWRDAQCHDGRWTYPGREQIFDRLVALGENPPVAEVDKIIGNESWTHIFCSGCSNYVDAAAVIDRLMICRACLDEGAAAIARARASTP